MFRFLLRTFDPRRSFLAGLGEVLLLLLGVTVLWWDWPVMPRATLRCEKLGPISKPSDPFFVYASSDGKYVAAVGESKQDSAVQAQAPAPPPTISTRRPRPQRQDLTLALWDAHSGSLVLEQAYIHERTGTLFPASKDEPPMVLFTPSGDGLIYVDQDPGSQTSPREAKWQIKLWNPNISPEPILLTDGPAATFFRRPDLLAFAPDNHSLVTGPWPEFRVWDLRTGKERPSDGWKPDEVAWLTRLASGQTLVVERGQDETLVVWDLSTSSRLWNVPSSRIPAKPRSADGLAAFSCDGKLLATVVANNVKIWDAAGKEIASIDLGSTEDEQLEGMAFGSDSRTVQLAFHPISRTGRKRETWDISEKPCHKLPVSRPPYDDLPEQMLKPPESQFGWGYGRQVLFNIKNISQAVAPDKKTSAWNAPPTITYAARLHRFLGMKIPQNQVILKDSQTKESLGIFEDAVLFGWFPDGKTFATVRSDGSIQLWDLPPRRPMWVEYGLPALFGLLIVLGGWYCYRSIRSSRLNHPS